MQCRVQRALWDLKGFARDLMDALGDRPAVHRLERERFEDQEVERALRQVESGVVHGSSCASTGRWKYAAALVEGQWVRSHCRLGRAQPKSGRFKPPARRCLWQA